MTDFGLEGFDPRRTRSERAFWAYLIGSIIAHLALMTWLLPSGLIPPMAAPAILVRLVNAAVVEPAPASGGPGEATAAMMPAPAPKPASPSPAASPKPSAERETVPAMPVVSPIKEKELPPPKAADPEQLAAIAPTATPALADPTAGEGSAHEPAGDGNGSPGGSGGPGTGPGGPGNGGPGGNGGATSKKRLPSSYTNDMTRRVQKNRHYPESLREQQIEGTARVRVTLNPDGSVAEVILAYPSGSDELDRAAIAAVQKTRFAPFPPGYDLPPQKLTFTVRFSLAD